MLCSASTLCPVFLSKPCTCLFGRNPDMQSFEDFGVIKFRCLPILFLYLPAPQLLFSPIWRIILLDSDQVICKTKLSKLSPQSKSFEMHNRKACTAGSHFPLQQFGKWDFNIGIVCIGFEHWWQASSDLRKDLIFSGSILSQPIDANSFSTVSISRKNLVVKEFQCFLVLSQTESKSYKYDDRCQQDRYGEPVWSSLNLRAMFVAVSSG